MAITSSVLTVLGSSLHKCLARASSLKPAHSPMRMRPLESPGSLDVAGEERAGVAGSPAAEAQLATTKPPLSPRWGDL